MGQFFSSIYRVSSFPEVAAAQYLIEGLVYRIPLVSGLSAEARCLVLKQGCKYIGSSVISAAVAT